MSEYYDRQGNRIGLMEWAKSCEGGIDQRRVAADVLPNGHWVSTVHLGIDHSFGSGPPLIFETMVFSCDASGKVTNLGELDCERYSTEAEAVAGHRVMVEKWSKPETVTA